MSTFNNGRWTELEHGRFLEALDMYGKQWDRVERYVVTRTRTQCRTHAQKYFLRLKKRSTRITKHHKKHMKHTDRLEHKAIQNLLWLSRLQI